MRSVTAAISGRSGGIANSGWFTAQALAGVVPRCANADGPSIAVQEAATRALAYNASACRRLARHVHEGLKDFSGGNPIGRRKDLNYCAEAAAGFRPGALRWHRRPGDAQIAAR